MNLSEIAFGVMTGLSILFLAAIFLMERYSRPADYPKPDLAETRDEDENPFKVPN